MGSATTVIRQADEGERLWFAGGGLFTMKASAAETNGSFILFEDVMAKGKVTPLHMHPNEEEALYLLDGEILIHLDGEEHRLGKGGFFMFPRGVPHAFMVTEKAHVIALQAPGTGEDFYRRASEPSTSESDADRPADWKKLREAAEQSDSIELLGPPPFEAARQEPAATS